MNVEYKSRLAFSAQFIKVDMLDAGEINQTLQARTALTEARTRGGDFGVTEEAEAR